MRDIVALIVVVAAASIVGVACTLLPVRGDNDCLNACLRSCPPPSPSSPTRESSNSQQSPCESDCVKRCR
jgi:hypothetical protein